MKRLAAIDNSLFIRCASRSRPKDSSPHPLFGKNADFLTTPHPHGDHPAEMGSPTVHRTATDVSAPTPRMGDELLRTTSFLGTQEDPPVISVAIGAMSELLDLIGAKRLPEALDLAHEILVTGSSGKAAPKPTPPAEVSGEYRDRFSVRTGRRVVFVNAAEVSWIGAGGDYATLHTARGNFLLRESIASLSSQLDPQRFVRVHRSTIVNLDEASELRSMTNRDALLRLRDGTQIRVSRSYISALYERLNKGCADKRGLSNQHSKKS